MPEVLGVILAGGQALRMGGGDKGRLALGDSSLLAEVIRRLAPQCGPLALSANGDPARFADLGLPVLPDSMAGYIGPLAGILAGMDYAAGLGVSHIVTAAGDTPFLPDDLAERLQQAASPIALAATLQDGRLQAHPTFGRWPVALRAELRTALQEGMRKVRHWADAHGGTLVEFPVTQIDPFFNVNTLEDLAQAQQHWLAVQR